MATNNTVADDDGWVYPEHPNYQATMVEFMSHFHGLIYPKNHRFTRSELLEITPLEIKRWMCDKAFGTPDIGLRDRPSKGRSSSLSYYKKALSHFMPNKSVPWMNGQGNPTRSQVVNDVIKLVKKYEVRGEGKAPEDKRPVTQAEFRKTLELLKEQLDDTHKFKYPCMALMQYHLIGRVDDCCELKMTDPRGHRQFPFALKTKVRWSKNVRDERNCPDQILFAAADPQFCIHLALAQYLEVFLDKYPAQHFLFTESVGPNAAKNLIATYRNRLGAVVWNTPGFADLLDDDGEERGVATHSYR
jgi:hypothetical protein